METLYNIGRFIAKPFRVIGPFLKEFFDRAEHPIVGLSLGLGILSVLLTIHAEILDQEKDAPYLNIVSKPWYYLQNQTPPPVNLSSLLPLPSPTLPSSSSQSSTATKARQPSVIGGFSGAASDDGSKEQSGNGATAVRPLYVFALDVSGSMMKQEVSQKALNEYREKVNSIKPLTGSQDALPCFSKDEKTPLTNFPFARAELCRYIKQAPEGSRVALWKFSSAPDRHYPAPGDSNSKWKIFEPDPEGGHVRDIFLAKIPLIEPTTRDTDFVNLFEQMYKTFEEDIQKQEVEVHFTIISDFMHDAGALKGIFKDSVDDSVLASDNSASAMKITESLRKLVKKGKTFHLIEVKGAQHTVCKVLPIVADTLEVFTYRTTQLFPEDTGKDFDFLRPTEEGRGDITFFYSPGNFQAHPVEIKFDRVEFASTKLRFTLVSEAGIAEAQPLKIKSKNFTDEELQKYRRSKSDMTHESGEILRPDGRGGEPYTLDRNGAILLQPRSILEPREAAGYRLFISWKGSGEAGKWDASNKTYALRIRFYQQLSWYGALGILMSEIAVLFFSIWTAIIIFQMLLGLKGIRGLSPRVMNLFSSEWDKNTIRTKVQSAAERFRHRNEYQLQRLRKALRNSDDQDIFEGLFAIYLDRSRLENRFEDQHFAGRLLMEVNPRRPRTDLKEVISASLKTYNQSNSELPRYLANAFGKEQVLATIDQLMKETLSVEESANLGAFERWIRLEPAEPKGKT